MSDANGVVGTGVAALRPSGLAAAKLAAMRQVSYVQKQKAPGLNYSFAGEAALIEKLRPAMVEAGLTFGAVQYDSIALDQYTTAKGAVMNHAVVKGIFRLTHAATGETEDVQAFGEGSDTGDKTLNKAMTGALKYALRQTFLIETGDDPDMDPSDDQQRAGRGAPQQPNNPPPANGRPAAQQAGTGPGLAEEALSVGWTQDGVIRWLNEKHGGTYAPTTPLTQLTPKHAETLRYWVGKEKEKRAAGGTGTTNQKGK